MEREGGLERERKIGRGEGEIERPGEKKSKFTHIGGREKEREREMEREKDRGRERASGDKQ